MPAWWIQAMRRLVERWGDRIARRLLMAEVITYLLCARIALVVFPFQQLTWFFERPSRRPELTGPERTRTRKEVRNAIFKVQQGMPRLTTCFHRAIAAQALLRRRGVGTTLYYGATTLPERGLATHAWVQDGTEGVVGHLAAKSNSYFALARYPDPTRKPADNSR